MKNGKGSLPRNNYSAQFHTNYSKIKWQRGLNACCGKPPVYCHCDEQTKKEQTKK